MGVSANIQGGLPMPTIKEVLGDPAPPSEVPFRNGILLMIATAYAQANNLSLVVYIYNIQKKFYKSKNALKNLQYYLLILSRKTIELYLEFLL